MPSNDRAASDGGIVYASGTAHVVADGETHLDADLRERVSALCGASSTPRLLPLRAQRLRDEHQRGRLCERCLERLRERGASVPGLLDSGEVVA